MKSFASCGETSAHNFFWLFLFRLRKEKYRNFLVVFFSQGLLYLLLLQKAIKEK